MKYNTDVQNDIKNTIIQAEGTFNQKNGIAEEKQEEKISRRVEAINSDSVQKATEILSKYMSARSKVDARIISNEKWWAERYDEDSSTMFGIIDAKSNWLFNSIMNKLADFSDTIPEANFRARMQDDVIEAENLKHRIPCILSANEYEEKYMDSALSELCAGVSIESVLYDKNIDDTVIKNIDPLMFYFEPGVDDIENSKNVFRLEEIDNDTLREMHPELEDLTVGRTITVKSYQSETSKNNENKSVVIHWYYKKKGQLQYVMYVNNTVLFATENLPDEYPNGLYDDGEYPFVVNTMFKKRHSLIGFSYIDVCKNAQKRIDRIETAVDINTLVNAVPRYFKNNEASINEDDFTDLSKIFIVTNSGLGENEIRKAETVPLPANVLNERDAIIQELKQTSGNSDFATGTSSGGITAASAIAQLIETGSKGSRLAIRGRYRAFKKVIYKIIERERQFGDRPKPIRIVQEDGTEIFDTYSNEGLQPQLIQGVDGSSYERVPEFDIEVTAQKSSPYNKMSQNEFALQCYQNGFFQPENADASLACVNMMDFDHKEDVISQIKQNQTLLQENQMLKEILDRIIPQSNLTGNQQQSNYPKSNVPAEEQAEVFNTDNSITSPIGDKKVDNARQRVADSTQV